MLDLGKAAKQGLKFKFIDVQFFRLTTLDPTFKTEIFRRCGVINQEKNMSFHAHYFFTLYQKSRMYVVLNSGI